MRRKRGKRCVASMVDEKCCRDTAEGIEKQEQQLEWVNEEIKRGGRCGKRKSGICRSSARSVKYSDEKKIIVGGSGGGARRKGGKGVSDSKLASEKREHDGSRGARTRRHRANGGGSLSSRGSAATGMQCGLCAVLASLFRRAMCIAGSRRGSGESCYQELATEMQQHHQGHSQFSQQSSQPQRSPSFVAGSPLKIILPSSRSTSGSFNGSSNRLDDQSLRRERVADEIPGNGSSSRHHDDAVFVRISETEDASLPASGTSPLGSTSPHSPPIDTELPPPDPRPRLLSEPDSLLIENLNNGRCFREKRHTGRFLTMHKRRRKRLITRSLSQEHALLDDIFHGQVQCVLQKAGHWRFNAFTLETVTGGRSLPVLCVHLFQFYGLFQRFNLDVVRAWKLFALIEEGYHSTNPYHNSIHATDVTQAMHCFLQEEKIKRHLSSLEIMASLIAAVTHDLDHPGVNQPFLVATSNHLATLYENTSVLENHHWRSAIACLLESGVYDQLPTEIRPELERHISSLILATDITRQQEFLTRFKGTLDRQSLNMEDPENRHFILQISLKCADISNPCRPWDISRKWSYKVCEEFFRQGDYERQLNLPVTPLCDRQSMSIPRIQVGFFEFVVTPLYEEWHRFLGDGLSVSLMSHLRENQKRWEALVAREAAEETKTEMSDLEQIPSNTSTASEGEENAGGCESVTTGEREIREDCESPERVRRPSLPGSEDLGQRRFDRRHSVPISVSKPLSILPMIQDATTNDAVTGTPNVVIRRESLPSERIAARSTRFPMFPFDDGNLVDEALREMSSLSLLSSKSSIYESAGNASLSSERPVSAENLLPETSIASITSSATATRLSSLLQPENLKTSCQTSRLHLTRQQTFPPLQPYVRIRYMSTTAEMAKCQTEALIEADDSLSSPENASITEGEAERLSAESGLVDKRVSSSRRSDETAGHLPRRHSVQTVSGQSDSINFLKLNPHRRASVSIDSSQTEARSPEPEPEKLDEDSSTRRIESSDMRRYSTPSATTEPANAPTTTTSSSSNYLATRRFTAIPLLTPEFVPTRKFFVGTPPGSPPRLLSVLSSSSDSGGSDPKPPGLADFNEAHSAGVKRDSSDNSRQRNCKIAKLNDDGDLKENLDPRTSGDEANKSGGVTFARRTNHHQSWARRRASAPVGLLSKLDDSPPGTVAPRTDRHSTRRGSVPTETIGQQVGGLRAALGPRGENVPLPRRASLPQEAAISNLLGNVGNKFSTDERENFPSYMNNNNNNNNNHNNNNKRNNNKKKSSNNGGVGCAGSSNSGGGGGGNITKNNNNGSSSSSGSNNNEICRISESISRDGNDFGSMGSPRRGSVPADISELRRDLFGRSSVNGKTRNRKKTLKRRSSGGPEMFSGRNPDDHENSKLSGWKRDLAKRDSSIPEPSVKRRGSLPVEMVSIFHPGTAAGARRSSLWRL